MIPGTAHFVWIGREFPWLHWVALASAARRGGFERVVLHHTDDLSSAVWFRELDRVPRVELRRLDAERSLESAAGGRLVDVYRSLGAAAAKSNLIRLALLFDEGGVYQDLDTVTLASLSELRRRSSAFCGVERIAFPQALRHTRDPRPWVAAFLKSAGRDVLRRSRHGIRWFRKIERYYALAANNAILGFEARHPFIGRLFERALALAPSERQRRYALGTGLLQDAVADEPRSVSVVAPDVFYPLGPELSEHWFRMDLPVRLADAITRATTVVHWYASVRTRTWVPRLDRAWVERHRSRQLISALVAHALEPASTCE